MSIQAIACGDQHYICSRKEKAEMRIITIVFAGLMLYCASLSAQYYSNIQPLELAPLSNHILHQPLYNPAFAGEAHLPTFALTYRLEQYQGDTPIKAHAYWQQDFPNIRSGIGFQGNYINFNDKDSEAFKRFAWVGLTHNFTFELGDDVMFRIGATYSMLHYNENIIPNSSSTTAIVSVVPLLEQKFKLKADVGASVRYKKFYGGLCYSRRK